MYISYPAYIEKFHNYDYLDYLEKTSTEFKNSCFTEYQRYIYDGKIDLTIHHYGRC